MNYICAAIHFIKTKGYRYQSYIGLLPISSAIQKIADMMQQTMTEDYKHNLRKPGRYRPSY